MTSSLCSKCKNHYVRGGWHCWSGNKLLGFCRFNSTPHPHAKHWNYAYKNGRTVEYQDIGSVKDGN